MTEQQFSILAGLLADTLTAVEAIGRDVESIADILEERLSTETREDLGCGSEVR